jgi:hypothetical protein
MTPLDVMWVGLGGGLGSVLRWWVGRIVGERYTGVFPLGTFLINISGGLAIGYLSVAAASANECPTANALVSAGRSFDVESPDRRRERYTRPGLCRRGALGSPPVSESGLTPHVQGGLVRTRRGVSLETMGQAASRWHLRRGNNCNGVSDVPTQRSQPVPCLA